MQRCKKKDIEKSKNLPCSDSSCVITAATAIVYNISGAEAISSSTDSSSIITETKISSEDIINPEQEINMSQQLEDHFSFHPRVVKDSNETGIEIEVMDKECYLIRKALDIGEQKTLFEYIQDRDKTPWDTLPRPMVPTPKTLVFGENGELMLKYENGQSTVVNGMIDKANAILTRNGIVSNNYKSISMATIQYASPSGQFPPHVDHCKNSFVYLMSLGCTANFMVKGPNMELKKNFKFHSGDLLIFNASTEAAILHGVVSIDSETSSPIELANRFAILQNHRYGVQCRLHF